MEEGSGSRDLARTLSWQVLEYSWILRTQIVAGSGEGVRNRVILTDSVWRDDASP